MKYQQLEEFVGEKNSSILGFCEIFIVKCFYFTKTTNSK